MSTQHRLMLALVVSAVVLAIYQVFLPTPAPVVTETAADSAAVVAPRAPVAVPAGALAVTPTTAAARTVTVRSPLYVYRFSTRGATLASAELLGHRSYVRPGENVQLVPPSARDVLGNRVAAGRDTVDFSAAGFTASADSLVLAEGSPPQRLTFTYAGAPGAPAATITYTFHADDYLVDVEGRISGVPLPAKLHTSLGTGLAPHDAVEHGTAREVAIVGWNEERRGTERLPLHDVEGPDVVPGPLRWAAIKDRYFLLALIAEGPAFEQVRVADARDVSYNVPGEKKTLVTPRAQATPVLPIGADGAFRFEAYVGPLEHDRLVAAGHELNEVNPYGYRILRPIVRPIAAVVLWFLNEMHGNLGLAYGWVLILFGVMVRIVTWPLNSWAMRAQMKNMAVQPELQRRMREIQNDIKDPRAQQQAIMQMYKDLEVSPFSMMTGCLPLFIPMPVLLTLFFVFQGAIEFRGTSFAWLLDLSLKDPWHILPVFLVGSMFALQYISVKMSGMEQNPQMKVMMYGMPLIVGVFFWLMPSGLNLYYAATNVASVPQQLLIAKERRRAMAKQKAEDAAKKAALSPRGSSGGSKGKPGKRK